MIVLTEGCDLMCFSVGERQNDILEDFCQQAVAWLLSHSQIVKCLMRYFELSSKSVEPALWWWYRIIHRIFKKELEL